MARFKAFSTTLILVVVCLFLVNFASADVWDNLVAYYNFDNNPNDYLGNHNGAIGGSPTSIAGILGTAYSFDGVDDEIFVSDNTDFDFGTGDFTFNMWFKGTDSDLILFSTQQGESGYEGMNLDIATAGIFARLSSGSGTQISAVDYTSTNWQMATFLREGTNVSIWINGSHVGSVTSAVDLDSTEALRFGRIIWAGFYDVDIDEVAIWKGRALSQTEVDELYNSGDGLSFLGSSLGSVTLVSPSTGALISDVGANFTTNLTASSGVTLENITYNVWWANGTIFNSTNININPAVSNNTILFIDSFVQGNFIWNVQVVVNNASGTFSFTSSSNFTFEVVPFSVISQSWANITLEGSSNVFTANLSFLTGVRLSSINLYYNDTSYVASAVEYESGKWFVSRTHQIPLVDTDVNVSFYWNVTLETGNNFITGSQNQTIKNLVLDDCSSGTFILFNFSLNDEDDLSLIDGSTGNTSIKVEISLTSLDARDIGINISKFFDKVNPASVCFNIDIGEAQFRVDSLIEYKANNRFLEFYNIQNFLLTNNTMHQNITLYNLNETQGTEFKITYKDSNFNLVPGAIIQIQRKYIDEGIFRTIEIPRISSAGYTIGHLVRNDVIYNLIILKDGVILDTFSNIVADCQNPALSECVININSFSSVVQPKDFLSSSSFATSISWNPTTRVFNSTFVILSGVPSVTTLNVTLFDGFGNKIVCADSLIAAGGVLSCTVPSSFGNSTVIVEIYNQGNLELRSIIKLGDDGSEVYGDSLVFLSLLIILLVIGMGITDNPLVLGVMLVLGMVVLMVLNLINNFGWLGAGASILWLVVAVVIILIKGSNRQ